MKKQNKKRQQQIQSRWLIFAGVVLALTAGIWIVLSSRQTENNGINPVSRLNTDDFHSLAFSLTEPETIYFGHHGGLMVSNSGGEDWKKPV